MQLSTLNTLSRSLIVGAEVERVAHARSDPSRLKRQARELGAELFRADYSAPFCFCTAACNRTLRVNQSIKTPHHKATHAGKEKPIPAPPQG